jgi:hypothetical protein
MNEATERMHPEAKEVLEGLRWRYPEATVTPFQRRGRTDHIILLPEAEADWIRREFPEAGDLREQAGKGELRTEPPVAWERMGDKRYARLRQSPSRVTRPAVNFKQLPLDYAQREMSVDEQLDGWMKKWSITLQQQYAHCRSILLGAFALGLASREVEHELMPTDEVPRLALDQNQHVGNRCHLILEGEGPASPFPLHILLYTTKEEPPIAAQQPGLASRFGARSHKEGKLLIASAPNDKIRFYLNKTELKKPFELPELYKQYLKSNHLLNLVLSADGYLREYKNRL